MPKATDFALEDHTGNRVVPKALPARVGKRRISLGLILLVINLTLLALPLLGVQALRLYESALIRQTESELITQGAVIAAIYRAILQRVAPASLDDEGYGIPAQTRPEPTEPGLWRPRPPILDLARDTIQPMPPDPEVVTQTPDPTALAVGRELSPILRDAQVVTLAGIRVVDFHGLVVASTMGELALSMNNRDEVRRALAGSDLSLMRVRGPEAPPPIYSISRGAQLRVYTAMPIRQDERVLGAVILSRTPANITQTLYAKRYLLLYGALLLLGVAGLIAWLTSFAITRPVRALVQQAHRAAAGERGAVTPLANPVTREVAELSEAVSRMAITLEQRAEYIKSFASHVSHEFKTPLTAIQGGVEILRDHLDTMSAEDRQRFLGNLAQDADRLTRLTQRLLELARADVLKPGENDTGDIIPVVQRLRERYGDRGLTVNIESPGEDTRVVMAEDTLEAVLTHLLDNAQQHGASQVSIDIEKSTPSTNTQPMLTLYVSDNGPGISAANAKRIFDPFFTTARQKGGTGMGLAITRSLLTAHGGHIDQLAAVQGAKFSLRFLRLQEIS